MNGYWLTNYDLDKAQDARGPEPRGIHAADLDSRGVARLVQDYRPSSEDEPLRYWHQRMPRSGRHYRLDLYPPEKQSATWRAPTRHRRPRPKPFLSWGLRARFVLALVVVSVWVVLA